MTTLARGSWFKQECNSYLRCLVSQVESRATIGRDQTHPRQSAERFSDDEPALTDASREQDDEFISQWLLDAEAQIGQKQIE